MVKPSYKGRWKRWASHLLSHDPNDSLGKNVFLFSRLMGAKPPLESPLEDAVGHRNLHTLLTCQGTLKADSIHLRLHKSVYKVGKQISPTLWKQQLTKWFFKQESAVVHWNSIICLNEPWNNTILLFSESYAWSHGGEQVSAIASA